MQLQTGDPVVAEECMTQAGRWYSLKPQEGWEQSHLPLKTKNLQCMFKSQQSLHSQNKTAFGIFQPFDWLEV
ncbi:hypothetical protein EK904_012177 [Melospiza melodia maxima]|nr:hypothetical protein EK904_012177 [Melospiza melodia maxima]